MSGVAPYNKDMKNANSFSVGTAVALDADIAAVIAPELGNRLCEVIDYRIGNGTHFVIAPIVGSGYGAAIHVLASDIRKVA